MSRDDRDGGGCDVGVQGPHNAERDAAAHQLGEDEAGHGCRRDARERVGEHPPTVTEGFAKLVEDVNQYAAPM